jgi:hypothetical protein
LAKTNYAYEKRQREMAKKQKQEAKRQRKSTGQGPSEKDEPTPASPTGPAAAPTDKP